MIKTQRFTPPPETEKEIQDYLLNELTRHKWLAIRFNGGSVAKGKHFWCFYIIHALKASAGLPDTISFRGARGGGVEALLVECKTQRGVLTASQKRFTEFAKRFGVSVRVIRSKAEVDELVKELENH